MRNEKRVALEKELQPIIAAALKNWRQKEGLTQAQMAKKLLIDLRTYSNLEPAAAIPTASTLLLFISLLDDPDPFIKDLCDKIKTITEEQE